MLERHVAERPADAGVDDRREARAHHAFVADRLEEFERIDDAVARKRIDDETLLVRGDHLLGRHVELEHAAIEEGDVLDERNLEVEARLPDHALRLAELQHQRLCRLVHRENGARADDEGDDEGDRDADERVAAHWSVPRLRSSGNGR